MSNKKTTITQDEWVQALFLRKEKPAGYFTINEIVLLVKENRERVRHKIWLLKGKGMLHEVDVVENNKPVKAYKPVDMEKFLEQFK